MDKEELKQDYKIWHLLRKDISKVELSLANLEYMDKDIKQLFAIYQLVKKEEERNKLCFEYQEKYRENMSALLLKQNKYLKDYSFLKQKYDSLDRSIKCYEKETKYFDENKKYAILYDDKKTILLDLDSKVTFNIPNKELEIFITIILKNTKGFIGYVKEEELPLLVNLQYLHEEEFVKENNKENAAQRIASDLEYARNFNFEGIDYKLARGIKLALEELVETKKKWGFPEEDYYLKFYSLMILKYQNLEFYEDIRVVKKDYFLKAYSNLIQNGLIPSDYNIDPYFCENTHHVKVLSKDPAINIELLKRRDNLS